MKYRPEIDGLRAFAVLSVVAFHAFPTVVSGGFIGVDIFFVISGFLITRLILEELRDGTFSLLQFFGRRVRRIFPALILVMLTCLVFGWFALLGDEYAQLGKHTVGGSLFFSNFQFWAEEAGYFTNDSDTKPLLHLWSLSVEEQFYLVWPLLLLAVRKRGLGVLAVILFVALASFAVNVNHIDSDPSYAFFRPTARFWELLSGALLAWLAVHQRVTLGAAKRRANRWLSSLVSSPRDEPCGPLVESVMAIIGLLLLVLSVTWIHDELAFPGVLAVIPVAGAMLVIASGGAAWPTRWLLVNPVATGFGLISYSLYLWHWPILSFLTIVESGKASYGARAAGVILSIFLASISYRLVERPARSSASGRPLAFSLVFAMASLALVGSVIYSNNGFVYRLGDLYRQDQARFDQLKSAGTLRENKYCRGFFTQMKGGLCVMEKPSAPTVLLLGDSHALHFYPGLAGKLPGESVAMLGGGWGGKYGGAMSPLLAKKDELRELIYRLTEQTSSIHTVVIAHVASDTEAASYLATFDWFSERGKRVVYAYDIPPLSFDPKACFESRPLRLSARPETACPFPLDEAVELQKGYREQVAKALAMRPEVQVYDPYEDLCSGEYCHAMLDGRLLYSNGGKNSHLSTQGSAYLGGRLAERLSSSVGR